MTATATSGGAGPYRKGAAFENRTAALLRRRGLLVTRNAGSKGDPLQSAFDLVAIEPAQLGTGVWVHLVECKVDGRMRKADRERLVKVADDYGALPILAYPDDKNDIRFIDLRSGREFAYVR